MLNSQIPLLTDIVEDGDPEMARQHQEKQASEVLDVVDAGSISSAFADNDLNQKIEQAIDAVLPSIKRQLHQQLLSALNRTKNS